MWRCVVGAVLTLAALAPAGCATKLYVDQRLAPDSRPESAEIAALTSRLDAASRTLAELETQAAEDEARLAQTEAAAQLALEQAEAVLEVEPSRVVLEDDSIRFAVGSAELGPDGRATLDAVAAQLLARQQAVYLEIAGHEDPAEGADGALALERARSVHRYLHAEHGIPAHRMNVVSYGTRPPSGGLPAPDDGGNRRVSLRVVT